jgi:hypothetical protein
MANGIIAKAPFPKIATISEMQKGVRVGRVVARTSMR